MTTRDVNWEVHERGNENVDFDPEYVEETYQEWLENTDNTTPLHQTRQVCESIQVTREAI